MSVIRYWWNLLPASLWALNALSVSLIILIDALSLSWAFIVGIIIIHGLLTLLLLRPER